MFDLPGMFVCSQCLLSHNNHPVEFGLARLLACSNFALKQARERGEKEWVKQQMVWQPWSGLIMCAPMQSIE